MDIRSFTIEFSNPSHIVLLVQLGDKDRMKEEGREKITSHWIVLQQRIDESIGCNSMERFARLTLIGSYDVVKILERRILLHQIVDKSIGCNSIERFDGLTLI